MFADAMLIDAFIFADAARLVACYWSHTPPPMRDTRPAYALFFLPSVDERITLRRCCCCAALRARCAARLPLYDAADMPRRCR